MWQVHSYTKGKGSSTSGLTYSPNVPNEQKIHIPATPKTGLSSDNPRVVNTQTINFYCILIKLADFNDDASFVPF
jgi:hypothetical protein